MNTNAKQELRYAMGMVERRIDMVAGLDDAETRTQAVANHKGVCGAVREVRKHYHNIVQAVDNDSAQQALQCSELVKTVETWLGLSRAVLATKGIGESEVQRIEEGVL